MKLRGAFIGFGNIAQFGHYPSYAKSTEAEIVAVMDPSAARQEAARKLNSAIHTYSMVDELFAKEKLDFVDICTPPSSHALLALKALAHGCHVLCEKPLTLKLDEYKALADGVPGALQQVLNACQGKPTERLVEGLTLRSLKQAVYSAINKGHFGLASQCYTHFTSPIRRYPDLLVHRLIRQSLRQEKSRLPVKEQIEKISEIALKSSKRERLAVDAEREYFDVLKVRLMLEHVGEEFEGVISSVTSFGFFVQLHDHFVEGLVRLANIREDFFVFDEVHMALRGRRTGMTFHLGQPVRVKLAAANLIKRQLDLEWLPPAKKQRAN